jgi:DNA-binding transcriptional LysR family regulator
LDGNCRVAIIGSLPEIPAGCASEFLLSVAAVAVVAPGHALAAYKGAIPQTAAGQHVQLVLTDRSSLTAGRNFGVMSAQTWRLADLGAKHAFLKAGLGWGYMPQHMVEDDLRSGKLVQIKIALHALRGPGFSMHAIHMKDHPPGPAGRWFVNHLKRE